MTATTTRTRRRRPPASAITAETPIWCPGCQAEHPASAFNRESRRFSGLARICREAQPRQRKPPQGRPATAMRNQQRWADLTYREKSLEWQRQRRKRLGATVDLQCARRRLQRIIDEWKLQGCVDCGYDDVRAIDPDHRNDGSKAGHLSRMVQLCASETRINEELAKCLPRCARCHRRVTQQQRPSAWRKAERLPPSWRRRLEAQDWNDEIKLELGCGLRLGAVAERVGLGSRARRQGRGSSDADREQSASTRD